MATTGTTKAVVHRKISVHLGQLGVHRDSTTITKKLLHLEKGYRAAMVFLKSTGSGYGNPDPDIPIEEKMEDAKNQEPEVDFSCGLLELPEDVSPVATSQLITGSVKPTPQPRVSEYPEKKCQDSKTPQKSLTIAEALQKKHEGSACHSGKEILSGRKEARAGRENCRRGTRGTSTTKTAR
ncbi:hypothetical protein RvY_01955-2 [Ramazzottius varieornatus]|uniref:Uncharacterized protein n=1 Tax=Ramazzottius varieornatus TaxID=947166 RepID=A0A1D1USR0_RAMVA|nr:hypothetical protein RvY_01955-2 [Ramazzottius varieornatus]